MQLKILSKHTVLPIVFVGFLFALVYFYPYSKNVTDGNRILSQEDTILIAEQEQAGLPKRLKIPKINVDAAIEYVGLTPLGAMDIPKGPDGVVWFEPGERPGVVGSAVIAGHYGWKDGKKATFDNLHVLQKGDKVYVEDENGLTISFVVKEIKKYDEKADASNVFGSSDGKSHLNLITCEGVWSKTSESYSQRLIVFTDREIE